MLEDEVTCGHEQVTQTIVSPFTYDGSCLGPFEVEIAKIKICVTCGEAFYDYRDARRWDLRKAMEILKRGDCLTPLEFRFLRGNMGISRSELAAMLSVHPTTVWRWEEEEVPAPSSTTMKILTCLMLLHSEAIALSRFSVPMDHVQRVARHRAALVAAAVPGIEQAQALARDASLFAESLSKVTLVSAEASDPEVSSVDEHADKIAGMIEWQLRDEAISTDMAL